MKLGFDHLSYSCFEMGHANLESENPKYPGGSFADLQWAGWVMLDASPTFRNHVPIV